MKHTECKDCELSNGDCCYHFEMDGVTNFDIPSLSACDQYGNCMFFKAKAEPKGDTISRSDIKDHIGELLLVYSGEELTNAILNAIDNAPTVDIKDQIAGAYNEGYVCGNKEAEKQRPQGEWIHLHAIGDYKCSICGAENLYKYADEHERWIKTNSNFCPNCGAKMQKGGVEE